MKNLRPEDQPLTIWIDQVCINQDDFDERSQQVMLMRDIYTRSQKIYIWLEEYAELCEAAFGIMPKILDCVECTLGYLDSNLIEEITARAKTRHMPEATEDVVSALTVLYENSWFTRSWTFQEITCAPDAEVFAGRMHIALTIVSNFAWVFPGWYDIRISAQLSIMASRAMGQTLIITTYRDLCKNPSLLELAKDTRERQATDPKDKLHSL